LTSALEGVRGQLHAPAAPYPREGPGTHCTGGWVALRVVLDRCGKSRPYRDSLYRLRYPAHRFPWVGGSNVDREVYLKLSITASFGLLPGLKCWQ